MSEIGISEIFTTSERARGFGAHREKSVSYTQLQKDEPAFWKHGPGFVITLCPTPVEPYVWKPVGEDHTGQYQEDE